MRDRLAEIYHKIEIEYLDYLTNIADRALNDDIEDEIQNRQDFYVDKLIANGVIVPPCKVGDKLYFLCGSKVFNLTVEKIVIKEEGMFLVDKAFNDWYSIEELAKTLYLSEEEAEQALKGGAEE